MSAEASVWVEGGDVIEVVLSWCDRHSRTVLAVEQVEAGRSFALGERGDALVPEEVLGVERFEIVRHDGESAVAFAPARARLRVDGWPREERTVPIERGHVVELEIGAFVVRMARVRAERRPAVAPLESLRGAGAGFVAGSALAHAAVFAVIAFFAPALGATEEDPFDADRLALIRHMLNASAQREADRTPDDARDAKGGSVNAGAPARGAEGQAGKPEPDKKDGRWAARGTARPEEATLPRERELAAAASFGILGIIPTSSTDPNAPTLPWGTVLNGSDEVNKLGHLYAGAIDDAMGSYGWGLSSTGEGGGGRSGGIGFGDIGGLGHAGRCLGPGPCDGFGVGHSKPGGGHTPHVKGPRYETAQTNGHLPAEVIQRIVRQNDGRYRFCYQNALKQNPTLQGRVTVKFLIDRHGAVAFAADGGSDIPDEGVRQCVVASFANLSFPEPESGTVTVVYPLVFNPE
jgi:hypothetical protein